MNSNDRLLELLIEFFNLPPDTRPENVTQEATFAKFKKSTFLTVMHANSSELNNLTSRRDI
jgi:hypothetical protein